MSEARVDTSLPLFAMSAGSKSASNFGRLALVVDLNAASWATFFEEGKSSQGSHLTLSSFLDQLLALAHQYSMLDRNNRVSLMTFNTEWCVLLESIKSVEFRAMTAD